MKVKSPQLGPKKGRKRSHALKQAGHESGRVVRGLLLSLIAVVALCAYLLGLALLPMSHQAGRTSVDLDIEAGTSVRQIIALAQEGGLDINATYLYWLFRLSGQAKDIKAGSYEIAQEVSPWDFLQKITRGDETLKSVTLVEGWTGYMHNALPLTKKNITLSISFFFGKGGQAF